ncbi:hypothetical protein GC088_12655 [Arthrobacter sp. JZ12]|uniref:DUF2975 domain-containing protein n=1 Tax=Arthrobacter sp. JZ12 TaxID=2654190 RepID=UPI002B4600C3|nr:DUF2975 domain-containing protein [Arthrobacter sp. JZ12]WRH25837.1 hypothetical protein GC088_12655 [Arthrobacter sp. JZ12]
MSRHQVALARILLGALAVGAVLAQAVIVPQLASDYAERFPEVAHLEAPYVLAVVVALAFFEVALLAAWQLLAAEGGEREPVRKAKPWTNIGMACLCLMALIFAGICVHAGSVAKVGGPAMLFGLVTSVAFIATVLALRSKATTLALEKGAE